MYVLRTFREQIEYRSLWKIEILLKLKMFLKLGMFRENAREHFYNRFRRETDIQCFEDTVEFIL